jgi:riboflavin kinase/FMN adenylyltransferase
MLLRGFEQAESYRGGFVAIGNFDGVHRGHQSMVKKLVERARGDSAPAVVLTFEPHPIAILRPHEAPPALSTVSRKSELLHECGVDCVIAYPTDESLLHLSPREFFERIVVGELAARGLVEGPNFFFGRNRAGDIDTLRALCDSAGIVLEIAEPVSVGGVLVSSSTVRARIAAGDVKRAAELLGHRYQISGTVVRGAGRGREIGFPTANLTDVTTLVPAQGVYAAVAGIGGKRYPAAVNIGPNPTFGDDSSKLEVHLDGFSADVYGRQMRIEFIDRLRAITTFASADALVQQLVRDVESARALASDETVG